MAGSESSPYWLFRFVYLRALGFIYVVAFLIAHHQVLPLLGHDGLEPADLYLERLGDSVSFWQLPTLFRFDASDAAFGFAAALGLLLAWLVLCGVENALVMATLWALQLSFVHVGQDFYGYGWEILLLEAGFLAIFLCPVRSWGALEDRTPPPFAVVVMLRWLVFRVMFGAGLIKIRGDACWRDLSCLVYHYETQPNPSPVSWLLHQAPLWFQQLGVLWNHFVELLAPWFVFGPRWVRTAAGACIVLFQCILIASGNLSFLNWLTLAITLACFDDGVFERVLPRRLSRLLAQRAASPLPSRVQHYVVLALACIVLVRSYQPITNMLSPHQRMNGSFDPLHLVNTYGAFGSVGKERDEVILEGTTDAVVAPDTRWHEYQFKCKPGDVSRRPCLITPYHYRLDWQMWFAALGDYRSEPFILSLIHKLLQNDPGTLSLIAENPFPNAAPRFIRAERYRYAFTHAGEPGYWKRKRLAPYLPPLAADDPRLLEFLVQQGYVRGSALNAAP